MIIMAVDYGDVRTGIAVCDRFEMLASPVCVITGTDEEKVAEECSAKAKELKAERVVVGYPKNMDGSEGFRAEKCAGFARLLSEKSGLETVLYDERLTTVSAHNALNAVNVRGKKRKQIIDSVAAVMILESYLDRRRLSGDKS